jgi:hypothetical protein
MLQPSTVNKIRLNNNRRKTFNNNFIFAAEKSFCKQENQEEYQNLFIKSDKKEIL